MKLVILGDTHFRKEEPFFSAQKEFCKWFINQSFNNKENYFLHLGDFYNESNPNPVVHEMGINFLKNLQFKQKVILIGNHGFNRSQLSYAEEPLKSVENVKIIYKPQILEIEDLKCLILPFIYDKTYYENRTMKEVYENLFDIHPEFNLNFDHIFTHIQDSTVKFNKDDDNGINIDYIEGERHQGHIHSRQKGYLGTPLINNFTEKEKESYILVIDLNTKEKEYVRVPQFLDYYNLDYEKNYIGTNIFYRSFIQDNEEYTCQNIYDIINAPSKQSALDKFKGLYTREIYLKKEENSITENNVIEEPKGILEYYENFKLKTKMSKKMNDKIFNYIE